MFGTWRVKERRRPPKRTVIDPEMRRVTATFGSIRVALHMDGGQLSAWPWFDAPGLPADVEVHLRMEADRPARYQPSAPGLEPANARFFSGNFITGMLDVQGRVADFVVHPSEEGAPLMPYHAHDGAKEAAFLVAVELLIRRGGLAFHAAAIGVQGRAHLICGESGAGKSTLCGRFDHGWLGDEWALVAPTDDGWELWRWAQWHWRWPDEPWRIPVGGVLGLASQRDATRSWPATLSEGVGLLVESAYWLPWWPMERLLDGALQLAQRHPLHWLSHHLAEPVDALRMAMQASAKEPS